MQADMPLLDVAIRQQAANEGFTSSMVRPSFTDAEVASTSETAFWTGFMPSASTPAPFAAAA